MHHGLHQLAATNTRHISCYFILLAHSCTALSPVLPARPTVSDLSLAKSQGDVQLWGIAKPRARPVQAWELRLFFPQRSDRDMQQQLGFRTQRDADKTVGAMVAVSIIGVIASLFLLGGNEPVGGLRSALGYTAAITPFAAISAGVFLPDQIQTLLVSAWRLVIR